VAKSEAPAELWMRSDVATLQEIAYNEGMEAGRRKGHAEMRELILVLFRGMEVAGPEAMKACAEIIEKLQGAS
jgi:hypothetical protein